MIIYFLLIGFASLLVGVEFIIDTQSGELRETLLSNFQAFSRGDIDRDAIFAPIENLRNKAILMIAIILFVMIIILTMFIKKITEPLQHMIELAKDISSGDLSRTVRIHSDNELSELGNVINEMSSNLQEIIMLSQNLCANGQDFAATASDMLERDDLTAEDIAGVREEIQNFKNELDMLEDVIEYFNFYKFDH